MGRGCTRGKWKYRGAVRRRNTNPEFLSRPRGIERQKNKETLTSKTLSMNFFIALQFFLRVQRGKTLTWGLKGKRGTPHQVGGYCIIRLRAWWAAWELSTALQRRTVPTDELRLQWNATPPTGHRWRCHFFYNQINVDTLQTDRSTSIPNMRTEIANFGGSYM